MFATVKFLEAKMFRAFGEVEIPRRSTFFPRRTAFLFRRPPGLAPRAAGSLTTPSPDSDITQMNPFTAIAALNSL